MKSSASEILKSYITDLLRPLHALFSTRTLAPLSLHLIHWGPQHLSSSHPWAMHAAGDHVAQPGDSETLCTRSFYIFQFALSSNPHRCFPKHPALPWHFSLPFHPTTRTPRRCARLPRYRENMVKERKLMKLSYLNQFYFLPFGLTEKDVPFPQTGETSLKKRGGHGRVVRSLLGVVQVLNLCQSTKDDLVGVSDFFG